MPTRAAVVGIGLLVDAHAITATLATCAVAAVAAGAGTIDAGFAGGTGVPARPTVVRIGLGIGAGAATAVRSIARATGAAAFLAAIGADAGAVLTHFIRTAGVAARPTVGVVGIGIDTSTIALSLSRWTGALPTRADLVGTAGVATDATILSGA